MAAGRGQAARRRLVNVLTALTRSYTIALAVTNAARDIALLSGGGDNENIASIVSL